MKSHLDIVRECDQFQTGRNSSHLYRFLVSRYDRPFGYLLENTVRTFTWPEFWEINDEEKTVKLLGRSLEERNVRMRITLTSEREKGSFRLLRGWTGEEFAVYGPNKELVVSIEKTAAPLFGITTYGVQLLAYREDADGMRIWIARRAKTKRTFPGMLDSTVGGSMPTGETPFQCLIRESAEEALLPEDLVRANAKACGTVNYVCVTDERGGGELGLICPEVQFTYEMVLPKDVIPTPGDGEAETIELFSIEEVQAALRGGEFTPANGCIIIDFFIRHGIITFENERDYIEIASRIHRCLEFPTA
ncbi:MAG: hypothetical protein M1839_002762 [Geoglossum umbratile]|nr:MAG: hypothetical protein M1839_002762 [Geoglossum umbratile]